MSGLFHVTVLAGCRTENVRGYRKCIFLLFIRHYKLLNSSEVNGSWSGMGMAQAPCELHRVFPYLFMGGVLLMCLFLSVDVRRDASCLKQSFCNTEGQQGRQNVV